MMKYLAKIEPQRVPLFAGALILLVAAALGSYLVLPQYQAQRAAAEQQVALERTVGDGAAMTAEQARLYAEVEQLEGALSGDGNGLQQPALEAFVIGRLQDIAWRRGIELVSIQPSPGGRIGELQETLFELQVVGQYADLHAWLGDLRADFPFVVIRELVLAPLAEQDAGARLHAAMIAAAYGRAG